MDARTYAARQVLYTDTRQQRGKHDVKERWWAEHGVPTIRTALPFGDYARDGSNVCIDTKQDVKEVAANVTREHERFVNECKRARDAGWRLIILVEEGRYSADRGKLASWTNPHCVKCPRKYKAYCDPKAPGKCARHGTRKPVQGPQLLKAICTIEGRYGVRFEFCGKEDTARRVCELLGLEVSELG